MILDNLIWVIGHHSYTAERVQSDSSQGQIDLHWGYRTNFYKSKFTSTNNKPRSQNPLDTSHHALCLSHDIESEDWVLFDLHDRMSLWSREPDIVILE